MRAGLAACVRFPSVSVIQTCFMRWYAQCSFSQFQLFCELLHRLLSPFFCNRLPSPGHNRHKLQPIQSTHADLHQLFNFQQHVVNRLIILPKIGSE
jgi:hypothetical protein